MAQILRPTPQANQDRSQISTAVAATSGQGLVSLGANMVSIGRQFQQSNALSLSKQVSAMVDQQGKAMYAESARAHQSALLLNKTTEAAEAFTTRATERYRHTTDADGNPTFQNLHTDIGSIGKEVTDDIASKILDPQVKNQFQERFGSYVANQKVKALKTGMQQQLNYGISSLDKGLGNLIQQASTDDIDQLGGYEQQGIDSIREAFEGGLISQEDYQKQSREFSISIREATLQSGINSNRNRVKDMLQLPADELGLPEDKKERLSRTLDAAERTDQAEMKRAEERQKMDQITQENNIVEGLESRIQAGALREDTLLSMQDKISPAKFSELKRQYLKSAERRVKELNNFRGIGLKIANGQDISDVKAADISGLHKYMVQQVADRTQQPVTLAQEAQLAASIPAPVKAYAAKLEQAAKFGNVKQAEDTLSAYTYIKDRNKPSLESGFDKEATLIMEHTELLVERAGKSPEEAMQEARELISGTDENARNTREKLFSKESAFKIDKIEETAASNLEGAESFFGTNRISPDAVDTFKTFAKEGYIRSGNKDTAVAYAKEMMKQTHGMSEVSGSKQFMFQPPEKIFTNYSSDQLRDILVSEASPTLPNGTDPETIGLVADDLTAGQVQGDRNATTWVVTYKKTFEDGSEMEMPLINKETGQPVRWSPAGTKVFEERAQEKFEDAGKQRQEFLKNLPEAQQEVKELENKAPKHAEEASVKRTIEKATTSESHFELAKSFLGTHENSKEGRQTLKNFFESSMGRKVDPAKTPWCAAFVNSVVRAQGVKGTGSLMAKSFLKWGEPTTTPKKGDIVVFSRGKDPRFGHVGFYAGTDSNGNIKVLGGNQGNKVSIKTYPKSRLVGARTAPKAEEIKANIDNGEEL